jgi:hypothetical protein
MELRDRSRCCQSKVSTGKSWEIKRNNYLTVHIWSFSRKKAGMYGTANIENVSQTEGPGNLFAKIMTIRKKPA